MSIDQTAFNQIAKTLSEHFDSLFYIEIETGHFTEFVETALFKKLMLPKEGEDFFALCQNNMHNYVHPEDLEKVLQFHRKEVALGQLENNKTHSIISRLVIDGQVIHIRHIALLCEDRKHLIFCVENIEKEVREKEEHKRSLQSAQLFARRDELTGIKNKNAFTEQSELLDQRIRAGETFSLGVVMCDLNDLKLINDTRGHSFGDEAIQRTSRMICHIFKHSPVYRVGGDEFVAILTDEDFEQREMLMAKLHAESAANGRARSGPVVAGGLAVYEPGEDPDFQSVFERADRLMYENKKALKGTRTIDGFKNMELIEEPIPDERKRLLDGLFGALYTVSGGGYVFLNDMKYDYSRWSLSLIDDFGIESEYMYHADQIWQSYIHPEDEKLYREAVDAVLCGNAEIRAFRYRAKKADGTYVAIRTRGFVLMDQNGEPEYFGGIMIPG